MQLCVTMFNIAAILRKSGTKIRLYMVLESHCYIITRPCAMSRKQLIIWKLIASQAALTTELNNS